MTPQELRTPAMFERRDLLVSSSYLFDLRQRFPRHQGQFDLHMGDAVAVAFTLKVYSLKP